MPFSPFHLTADRFALLMLPIRPTSVPKMKSEKEKQQQQEAQGKALLKQEELGWFRARLPGVLP